MALFVGIDVSKEKLDVAVRPTEKFGLSATLCKAGRNLQSALLICLFLSLSWSTQGAISKGLSFSFPPKASLWL